MVGNNMETLQKAAKIGFASEYSFVIKAQNFHWNVTGPLFEQYHALFEKIYTEVYSSIDPFAENIRKLRAFTPTSFGKFSMLSQVEDEDNILTAEAMVAELLQDSDKMVKVLKLVYDQAERTGEHGFSNFLAERIDAHQKHSWMLRASLGAK
jgi:starvation-inducible DNA-binding protein